MIVLLGDSLSVGTGPFLQKLLGAGVLRVIAQVGAPISWMQGQVDAIAALDPDVVLVMGGTNDLANSAVSPEIVMGRLGKLVQALDDRTNARVFVSTLPPQKTANEPRVAQLNGMILDTDRSVDVGSRIALGDLGPDGIHPGPAGYQKMAQGWSAVVETPEGPGFWPVVGGGLLLAAGGYLWWRERAARS